MSTMNILYTSSCLVMLEDYCYERFYVINVNDYDLGLQDTKMLVIDTYTNGLTNNDVEDAIKQVLHNGGYDIEYEIEEYRKSRLYEDLRGNEDE